jgi:hypothetical protein
MTFLIDNSSGQPTSRCHQIEFRPDCTKDIYQIGRAVNVKNDFVLPGQIHIDEFGNTSGPISRFACRIECERLPPFRCFIFSGGFGGNATSERVSVHRGITNKKNESIDGFTTFGVKVWQPELKLWLEVSILGNTYVPRQSANGSMY